MNREIYDKIVEIIYVNIVNNKSATREIIYDQIITDTTITRLLNDSSKSQTNPISYETFTSIYNNLKRREMSKASSTPNPNAIGYSWRRLKEDCVNLSLKWMEYEQTRPNLSNIIFEMSKEYDVAPVLMVRLILNGFLKNNPLEIVTAELIEQKITPTILIKETHLLKNGRLGWEIYECCAIDDDYGPSIDLIKNLIGIEYEMKLETTLKENDISYVKESELRERGFDKTPDFKLEIPIYLENGTCINWIDSKASFGDQQSHMDNYETQFKYYLNRFGSGLVIYWFGYLNDIKNLNAFGNQISKSSSVIISDKFPNEFKTLNLTQFL